MAMYCCCGSLMASRPIGLSHFLSSSLSCATATLDALHNTAAVITRRSLMGAYMMLSVDDRVDCESTTAPEGTRSDVAGGEADASRGAQPVPTPLRRAVLQTVTALGREGSFRNRASGI